MTSRDFKNAYAGCLIGTAVGTVATFLLCSAVDWPMGIEGLVGVAVGAACALSGEAATVWSGWPFRAPQ